jgi:SagB-type dehydrogenase family enzyme
MGIGRQFFRDTEYSHLPMPDQQKGLPQPPLTMGADEGAILVDLPAPAALGVPSFDLRQAIEERRSVRAYSQQSLTAEELSWLLWSTQGVQKVISRPATVRPVPSAGARHAFETYLLINRVEGIEPGLYRYVAIEHKLALIDSSTGVAEKVMEAAYGQEYVFESAVTFIWTAVAYRMTWRYTERGYRYLLLDAGHVCQNLYLAAEPIRCGVCAIAAFYDAQMDQVLGLDGENRFTVYLATVGKIK